MTEDEALRVHRDALVVDTLNFGVRNYTPTMLDAAQRMIEAGASGSALMQEMNRLRARAWCADTDGTWAGARGVWRRAGVDVVLHSEGVWGEPPFGFAPAVLDLAWLHAVHQAHPGETLIVRRADDLVRAHAEGRCGFLPTLQNAAHFEGDLAKGEALIHLGIRSVQLTYNSRNALGDGCTERVDAGLTHYGVRVVRFLNEQRVLVDVSHCGLKTSFDALEVSTSPVVCTHVSCAAVYPHARAKPDDFLRGVIRAGGYIGIFAVPGFMAAPEAASVDSVVDHIVHVVDLGGIDCAGIGTDWGDETPDLIADMKNAENARMGFGPEHNLDYRWKVRGYESWERWPAFTAALARRGFSAEEIRKILGLNFLHVFESVVAPGSPAAV